MPTPHPSAPGSEAAEVRAAAERLRGPGIVFAVALALHAADHLRRSFSTLTPEVLWAGNLQTVGAAATLVLIFRRHRWAPLAAIAIGFPSAVGFVAAHLLPHWSAFSDSFIGARPEAHVNAFSWLAAVGEILADLWLGWAGLQVVRRVGLDTFGRTPTTA